MDPVKTSRRPATPYLIILAAGLLAHGMLLLNDGKYMEGWFLDYLIRLGKWEVVKNYWVMAGYPLHYWLQRLLDDASMLTIRALSFSWILLTAVFQYKILARFTPLTQRQSLYLTVFALIWPFYHLLVWSLFVTGIVFTVLFYAGWYSYLCLKEKKSHPLLYLPSLILIFLSFNYPVFLTYQFAFLMIYGLGTTGCSLPFQLGEFKTRSIAFLKQNWILALLPFLFFYLKKIYYPVTTSYNEIKLFSLTTLLSILKNIFRLITEPLLSIIYSLPTFWFVLIPVLLAASFFSFKYFKGDPEPEGQQYALGMIAVGLIILMTHSITYGVVWKTIKIMSVKSRYGFTANLGYGLFLMGGIHWLFNKYWAHRKELIQPVLGVILVAMILVDVNLYAMWQAKWAKTVSVIHNLKRIQPVSNASIYFLKDEFPLGVGTEEYVSDFTLMLIEAWGPHQYFGMTSHYQGKQTRVEAAQAIIQRWEDQTLYFHSLVDQSNPKGCLAEVAVFPKKYRQQVLIGFRYIFYRLFNPQKMSQFLEDLTDVQLRPLNIDADDQPCH